MDKRFIPVAMLAGALALAGCGGGSSTTAPGSGDPSCGDDEMLVGGQCVDRMVEDDDDDGNDFEEVIVSGGFTYADFIQGENGSIRSGGEIALGEEGSGAIISCPDTATNGCRWRYEDGKLYATGGATGDPWSAPEAAKVGSNGGGNDWLSDASLIRAVKSNGSVEITRNNVDYAVSGITGTDGAGGTFNADNDVTATSGSAVGTVVVDAGGGLETDLRLIHTRNRIVTAVDQDRDRGLPGDYLVFGAWETRTAAIDAEGGEDDTDAPRTDPIAETVWAGTIPRNDPQAWGIGSARYEGRALGHYKHGSVKANDSWSEWDGTVELRANFAPGVRLINGTVSPREADDTPGAIPAAHGLGTINLGSAAIGASVNGAATIGSAGSGTWQAEFFGSATNGQPTGVAGGFKTERDAVAEVRSNDGSTVITAAIPGAVIQGAFGAHNVDVLLDTVE